jgi:hypothetical protein
MPRTLPLHSTRKPTPPIYHNNDGCYTGIHIEPQDWRPGDGDRRLCPECARLNAAGQEAGALGARVSALPSND